MKSLHLSMITFILGFICIVASVADGADIYAISYSGTGGERIQDAIDDCASGDTVMIQPTGPDAYGLWLVQTPITLDSLSNITIRSTTDATLPVIQADSTNTPWTIFRVIDCSNITMRRLNLQGDGLASNGASISGTSNFTFTMGVIADTVYNGIIFEDDPSSYVTVNWTTFDDNGNVAIRAETPTLHSLYHSNFVIENNWIYDSAYGVALANCGGSTTFSGSLSTRCRVEDNNPIQPSSGGSGIDLNRSHYAYISNNKINGSCTNGITIDNTMNAEITDNEVDGCNGDGIQMANGVNVGETPWWDTGNTIENNTVKNNGGYGLYSGRDSNNSDDHNEYNIWRYNDLSSNSGGGCANQNEGPNGDNTFYSNSSGSQNCSCDE